MRIQSPRDESANPHGGSSQQLVEISNIPSALILAVISILVAQSRKPTTPDTTVEMMTPI